MQIQPENTLNSAVAEFDSSMTGKTINNSDESLGSIHQNDNDDS